MCQVVSSKTQHYKVVGPNYAKYEIWWLPRWSIKRGIPTGGIGDPDSGANCIYKYEGNTDSCQQVLGFHGKRLLGLGIMTDNNSENLGKLNTETIDPRYSQIDFLSTSELLKLINENDQGVSVAVAKVLPQIEQTILEITKRMSQGGRLIYVGAGTSGRLGVLDASECIPTFSIPEGMVIGLIAGGDAALRKGIEGAEDVKETSVQELKNLKLSNLDTVVGIAASGRTPYAIGAMEYAQSIGALSIALTCNPNSEMSKYADVAIEVDTGPEVLAGSTRMKAGTAQKLVLNMISTVTMINLGKTFGNLMVDLQVSNIKLRDRAIRIIQAATQADARAAEEALVAANNEVKVAIVMLLLQVSPEAARQSLTAANSRIREAVKGSQNP